MGASRTSSGIAHIAFTGGPETARHIVRASAENLAKTSLELGGKNAITGLITFPTNKGDGWDRPILCKEKIFQFGDAIAIVAADTVDELVIARRESKREVQDLLLEAMKRKQR